MSSADLVLERDGVWRRHRRWTRRPTSIKEMLVSGLSSLRPEFEEFWALKDVSLQVRRGESIGFCGPNGAGKSTLLKVIARILDPTYGRIVVRGRLATMLELGTGFLGDLSGRENLILNGAILGLSDAELRDRTESIIEFSELGNFIDSPVRTYSTGMYMRLGFAIASHVEADILILDEVLAVGDELFQQKCLKWMQALKEQGTSVMIVSHAMSDLTLMSDRVVWLENGEIRSDGEPHEVVERYRERMSTGDAAIAGAGR